MNTFWIEKHAEIRALSGKSVVSVTGTEMAIRDRDSSGLPVFEEPGIKCTQLTSLNLELGGGSVIGIEACPADDSYGLVISSPRSAPVGGKGHQYEVFRSFELSSSEFGLITEVTTKTDSEGCVVELCLKFAENELHLVVGEIFEAVDGSLQFSRFQESILMFRSAEDLAKIPWAN